MLSDPRHPLWGDPPLPQWVADFRSAQRDAVRSVVEAFEADADVVVLSAPTGSGKTLVGEVVRRALRTRGVYVCTDRGLQDQVLRDFAYARVLKGRSNYPTLDEPDRYAPPERLSADDCTLSDGRCRWCTPASGCPYRVAKAAAREADLAVLNTSYFLAEANVSEHAAFTGLNLVVADEADRLESALMSHVSVEVSAKRLEGWGVPPLVDASPSGAAAWVEERLRPAVDRASAALLSADPRAVELRTQRALRGLAKLRLDLTRVLTSLPTGRWVTLVDRGVEFRPVWVDDLAGTALWRHSARWLLMSATVLQAEGMMADLGQRDPWRWAEVDMPSPFPVEHRPVHMLGAADVTHRNPDAARQLAEALQPILERHREERVLVHTVSFRLQGQLEDALPRSRRYVWYRGGAEARSEALARYLERPKSVLFAPGMERGVDLPDEACRAVVICKVPWPSLGDAQVAARLKGPGGQAWYRAQTLRSLVQMCGRGVRHERDRCATYVLDRQGDRIVRESRKQLPRWWLEAVKEGVPS